MKRRANGAVIRVVLAALREIERGTHYDVAEHCGINPEAARKVLGRLRTEPEATRRVRVAGWIRTLEGRATYPRPVYALGPGRNEARPKRRTHTELFREYRHRAAKLGATMTGRVYMPQKPAIKLVAAARRKGLL